MATLDVWPFRVDVHKLMLTYWGFKCGYVLTKVTITVSDELSPCLDDCWCHVKFDICNYGLDFGLIGIFEDFLKSTWLLDSSLNIQTFIWLIQWDRGWETRQHLHYSLSPYRDVTATILCSILCSIVFLFQIINKLNSSIAMFEQVPDWWTTLHR